MNRRQNSITIDSWIYESIEFRSFSLTNIPPVLFYNVIITESTSLSSCLNKCACSRRRISRVYISSLGTQCVQSVYYYCDSAAHEGLQYQWRIQDMKKGGVRTGFWWLAPKIFWVHFSQFRGLLKEFGENRGGRLLPLSISDFSNLCADLGLEVGLENLLCPSGGGGGCEREYSPPVYRPAPATSITSDHW